MVVCARVCPSMTSVFFFVQGSFWAEVLICHPSGYWEMCGKGGSGNVLDDLRSDDLAGTAPGSEEVNDHEALLAESGVEVGLAVSRIESVFSCFSRARLARECKRARACVESTYVVRLWTPVAVDIVEEKLRLLVVVVMLWLVVMLLKEVVVVVKVGLNGGVALRQRGAELKSARERRNADISAGNGAGYI